MNQKHQRDMSIIIVQYHVKKELFACIDSILQSKTKVSFEIIIVDNDEKKHIGPELIKKYPQITYLKSPGNVGFGAGNNIGAEVAKGEFLFFLNPDTKIYPHALDTLVTFLKKNKTAGVVAPLLLTMQGKPYQQGTRKLSPFRALFALSIINKFFPRNQISKEYWLADWDFTSIKKVDVVPGTAFMIRKKLYESLGGFDEHFFLYFEEFDLCNRVDAEGYELYITPDAQVSHIWGASTKSRNDINLVFRQSRFYYFKNNFGLLKALCVESVLRCDKYKIFLGAILALTTALSIYRLPELMPFIADQGWYYLSARDLLLTGDIPLVGIPSSHPWLHQGALWTYMLAGMFALFSFDPFSGLYLSIGMHLLTVFLMYLFGSRMFSERVGIIAALLYGTSPLVLFLARMPYHTSPIPLFTILYLYALTQWVSGKHRYFPLIIALLGILYNFEIATFLLTVVFILILLYGLLNKKDWAMQIFRIPLIILSILAFVISMLPMLIYDVGHGFPQTIQFLAWIGYKILVVFGYPSLRPDIPSAPFSSVILFFAQSYQKLIFLPNVFVAAVIACVSFGFFYKKICDQFIVKKYSIAIVLLAITFTLSLLGLLAVRTPSDAYLPIFFPLVIFITALMWDDLFHQGGYVRLSAGIFLGLLVFLNIYTVTTQDYFVQKASRLSEKIRVSQEIVLQSEGKSYTIIGVGGGSEYESFTMPYEYLTWYLGHGPSHTQSELQFILLEDERGIGLTKKTR